MKQIDILWGEMLDAEITRENARVPKRLTARQKRVGRLYPLLLVAGLWLFFATWILIQV